MSVDLFVYVSRTKMLAPKEWSQAIRAAGFELELDEEFDVYEHTGFLPCRFDGAESGFELCVAELTGDERVELGLPPDLDVSVTFTTHSDLRELAASSIAAGVLAHSTGGRLHDPQAGEMFEADSVLEWVRATLAEIDGA